MKRNLFALISVVLSLSEFSVGTLSAATDHKEHKFQDGIYTARADKKAEKSAVASSKENAAALVAATKSSNIYEQEAGAGIKMTSNLDDILNSLEVGSQVLVLNVNNPWSRNCWGCGYWGYYDPFYWDRWYGPWSPYDPFWRPWDPFWYDRWGWGWGSYHLGPWGPWGPWPYGPDPWWPGYRPIPVYPVYPARPAGTYATAMRGGNHNMGGSGLNRRIDTPAGGSAGSSIIGGRRVSASAGSSARVAAPGTGTRIATSPGANQAGRVVSRVPGQRITPVGTSVHGSKVATSSSRRGATATSVTSSSRRVATAASATPPSRQAGATTGHSQTPNMKINRNVRSSRSASGASNSSRSASGTSNNNYRNGAGSYGGSSRSYSGGSHNYSGGGGMSRSASSGGGMSRSISGGGHGRR